MEHGSKNKSMKNHNRKHYRDLWRAMSLYMSMIVSSCSTLRIFSSSKSIRISWSILFPLRDLHKGKTRLMTEKHAHLTSFILFGKYGPKLQNTFLIMLWSVLVWLYLNTHIFLFDFALKNFLLSLVLSLII